MEIRPYNAGDWITKRGTAIKRKQIYRKGVPNVKHWRFFTLTTCHQDHPLDEYLEASKHMKYFLFQLKEYLGVQNARWFWKKEFHQTTYIHWHLGFEFKKKLTEEQMMRISQLWSLGRVHVRMLSDIDYALKYSTKEAGDVPEWFSNHYSKNSSTGKPETFGNVRFWQTSIGEARFYTGTPTPLPEEKKPKNSSRVPFTFSQRLAMSLNTALVVATDLRGRYRKGKVINFHNLSKLNGEVSLEAVFGYASPTDRGFLTTLEKLKQHTNEHHKLKTLCHKHNRSPRLALIQQGLTPRPIH